MAGIKRLRRIQLGKETTAGTQVSPSTIWRGTGSIEDLREVIFVEEDVGYKSGTDRSYIPYCSTRLELEETPATFEQVLHILEAGTEEVSSVADGSGSGHIYAFPFCDTSDTATIQSYSIEGGDNQQAERFAYGYTESFTLSGVAGEAANMSAVMMGRTVDTCTFCDTATLPDVEEILTSKGKLYLDAVSGTIGTTQVTSTLLEFDLSVETGWKGIPTADGELYFTFLKNTGAEISLDLTFEHNASAVTEKANWRAETPRLLRLEFTGSTFTTAGTSYSVKTLQIDLAGKWETFSKLEDQDGNDVVTGTFVAKRNTTAAQFATIRVVSDLATPN